MADTSFEDDFNDLAAINEPAPDRAAPGAALDDPQEANQDAEPLAEGEQQAEPEAPTADPAPAEVKPPRLEDLLAFAPKDKADLYKAVIEQTAQDLHRLRSDDGRVTAMQRLYHEAKAAKDAADAKMKELEQRAAQPMTGAEKTQLAADIAEEQDAFSKEFPEFSDAVNVRFERLLKKHLPSAPPATQPAAAPQVGQQPAQTANDPVEVASLAKEYAALAAAHPDWQQATASPVYQSWKAAQSAETRRLIESESAADAIRVMDRFKSDLALSRRKQELEQKTESRTRLAQHVGVKGSPSRPTAVPDDFESAFNFYASKG